VPPLDPRPLKPQSADRRTAHPRLVICWPLPGSGWGSAIGRRGAGIALTLGGHSERREVGARYGEGVRGDHVDGLRGRITERSVIRIGARALEVPRRRQIPDALRADRERSLAPL